MNIPLYGQRDPRWGAQKINGTNSTMHDYGCTITCISMISGRTPGEQETLMRGLGAFQNDLVLWTKTPGFKWRFYCLDTPAPLEDIKNELRAGRPVLVHVDLGLLKDGVIKPNHWVLVVDENFTIHDPWFGDKVNICPRYGKDPATAIMGGAYFNPQTNLGGSTMDFKTTILQNKQNEYRIDGQETVRAIITMPSAPFFTGDMQCSFENVRVLPHDWPVDPAHWAGQREWLRGEVNRLIAEKSEMQGWINERDERIASLEATVAAAQDSNAKLARELQTEKEMHGRTMQDLRDCESQAATPCPECPPTTVPVIEMPAPAPKVTLESLIVAFFNKLFKK